MKSAPSLHLYLYFHSVLGVLDVLQRRVDVQRHHQAGREPQRVVGLARRLYDGGRRPMDLMTSAEI